MLDTRNGTGVAAGKLAAGGAITLKVTGGDVPADAKAVVLNLTATLADGPGFVTAWPTGQPQPPTSSLNLSAAGETAANAVVVPVGRAARSTSSPSPAPTWSPTSPATSPTPAARPTAASTPPAAPTRLLDTRNGLGGKTGPFAAGRVVRPRSRPARAACPPTPPPWP